MDYYIIGSKYGNQTDGFDDVLPSMLEKGVISTGFASDEDMHDFVGKRHEIIIDHLKSKSASQKSYSTLKHFLNLKPGDLVAVKIHSAPSGTQARLVIGAYAIIKGLYEPIYKHCEELGHTIEVDFIETNLDYELPFGYGHTIHKVEDPDRIKSIFGYYSDELSKSVDTSKECHLKSTNEIKIEASAGYVVTRAHNIIQNLLITKLVLIYGSECVKVEKSYIDVLVELSDKFIIYEVKSSFSADHCIREALGQILQYGHTLKKTSNKAIEYVVVGPSVIDKSDDSFYRYVANSIEEPFSYQRVFA